MKTYHLFVVGLITAAPLAFAQYTQPYQQPQYSQPGQPQYSPPPQPYPAQPAPNQQYSSQQYPNQPYSTPYSAGTFSPTQLDQLVSPIALYPDPLLGAMLPASTHPDQLAAAANYDASNMDPNQIDQQPWDESVKVVAHYPSVVEWMAQNPDWTNQLGGAVASQEPDVMNAIQQLRANARASGMLTDTPQQRVVVDQNNVISIVPAQPNTIYVPTYDPQWIESAPPPGAQFSISFGPAFALGDWPRYEPDWHQHSVWIDHSRDRGEPEEHHWWQITRSQRDERQQWQPPREMQMRERQASSRPESVARPRPFGTRGNEHALTPTGRANGMEYNRWNHDRQPQVQSEQNSRYQQNNNSRHEDRRDRRDEDDRRDDDR